MREQPHLPKLCFSNSLIYHNMTFWFYYTTTYFEKNPKTTQLWQEEEHILQRKLTLQKDPHILFTPRPAPLQTWEVLDFRKEFPDLGFLM